MFGTRGARCALVLTVAGCGDLPADPPPTLAPCAEVDPLRRPLFGDTHVHTSLSLDANLQGTRLSPGDAYAFARGESVGLPPYAGDAPSRTIRLDRPLDFAIVTDHSEFLGTVRACTEDTWAAWTHPECVSIRENPQLAFVTINAYTARAEGSVVWPALCGEGGVDCRDAGLDAWREVIDAALAATDPTDACRFSALVGYEWSGGPATRNLHRNVVFRGSEVPERPVSYFDAPSPEQLWAGLDAACQGSCEALAIPHNSNLSRGLMFPTAADRWDADVARTRARLEPLVEVFQHKGSSECFPGSLGADELCGFEVLPYNTLSGANLNVAGDPDPRDAVRSVLAEGLAIERLTGVNPYRLGLLASTDTHLGTPGLTSEADYPGHAGAGPGHREARAGLADDPTNGPGGLAVVWAEQNRPDAIFAALKRREVYGTSGPRIRLRVHAGADLPADLCDAADGVARADASGVPMGAVIGGRQGAMRVFAVAEADETPLERLQVVKGWLGPDGPQVSVIDVDGDAGDTPAGCEPPDGGAERLCAVWTDPEFDPAVPAFYHVRAVERPTCRWVARACADAGVTCPTDDPDWSGCCTDLPSRERERAWSSPVWYAP